MRNAGGINLPEKAIQAKFNNYIGPVCIRFFYLF